MSRLLSSFVLSASTLILTAGGCNNSSSPDAKTQGESDQSSEKAVATTQLTPSGGPVLQLAGGDVDLGAGVVPASYEVPANDPLRAVMHELQPLQVLIGTWRGVTVRAIGGAKAVENPQWNWDFVSDAVRPALVLTSKTSPYLRKARLTYITERRVFQLLVTEANGSERIYEGNWTQPPQETAGLNGAIQRSFKLRLIQTAPTARADEFVFNQESNDRYGLEIHRLLEGGLQHYDTVRANREGAPISIEPDKYAEHRCVVSGGMAALPVSHAGKLYHVCCEGCKAAFEANPQRWIAASASRH